MPVSYRDGAGLEHQISDEPQDQPVHIPCIYCAFQLHVIIFVSQMQCYDVTYVDLAQLLDWNISLVLSGKCLLCVGAHVQARYTAVCLCLCSYCDKVIIIMEHAI